MAQPCRAGTAKNLDSVLAGLLSRIEALLILICVIVTASLYSMSVNQRSQVANSEFRRLTEDSAQALRTRMMAYLQSIKGTAAFIAASDEVTANDFATYVNKLDIADQLPGIGGIGWLLEVPDAQLDQFVDEVRVQGQPDFVLRRRTDADMHYIIKYIEPLEPNALALGLDISFAPEPTQALRMARDTNTPQMTPPRELVQQGRSTPGFVLYQPVYLQDGLEGNRGKFFGWVQAVFSAESLIAGLTPGQGTGYQLQIVDGASLTDGQQIYDSRGDAASRGAYVSNIQLDLFGRTWTIAFNSTSRFDQAFSSLQPLTILIAGFVVGALMISILRIFRLRGDSMRDIANLRQRQIEDREKETRSIIENEVTSVLLLDASDTVIFANKAAQECFGYSDAELNNTHFSTIVDQLNVSRENHNAVGHTKSKQEIELDLQMNEWMTGEGEARTTVIIRDMTTQNTAERELKRNKAMYDMALQGSQIGVFDVNLVTGTSEVSETWCRIMGYDDGCNGMNTQRNFMSRIHPDDLALLNQADEDCIEGKTERSIVEYRLQTQDGGWCWMRSDAVVVERDADQKAIRMIGTQSDVTTLRHDRNALEDSEKRFRQVLANAPIGMALMDDIGNFIGINNAFSKLVGIEEEELLANKRLIDLIPKEERKKLYSAISSLMTNDAAAVYTAEHRILHTSVSNKWALLNVSWAFDTNKGSHYFIAQVIDITEQKRLDSIKDEFVSTVSHELRTPLTSIKGALALLSASKGINFTKPQLRLVDIASSNADRLTDIVNDILDLEKISSGEVTFNFADTDLTAVLELVVNEISPFAVTHDTRIHMDVPKSPLVVFADQGRTQQVLTNLISNACKYSDPDSDVLVKAEIIDDVAIVYVQNKGPGVPENFRPRIFKAFSQADSSDTRAKGGTGLGLNIARQIVLRHGGQIGFESNPGGVTVFWFTIPLSAATVSLPAQVIPVSQPATGGKLTVLHVEDDHDFVEIVSGSLRDYADVTHAKSIAIAKQALKGQQFDVVIMDWNLPDGDGSILLDVISRDQPHARIIALSADGQRKKDPRLFASMVKGRTEISTIVSCVTQSRSLAC